MAGISKKYYTNIPFILSVCMLVFGFVTSFEANLKWLFLIIIIYLVPVISQFSRNVFLRSYGIWFGIFLVLQTFISPIVINNSPKRLKPFLNKTVDVRAGIPGISGIQNITTDKMGFRITKQIDYKQHSANTYRVFCMGASTTEQIYLDDKKTWTHLLQHDLDDVFPKHNMEVVNTGLSGTRIVHHYKTLKDITPYHPDMVIFLIGMNDWNYQIMSHFNPFLDLSMEKTLLGKLLRRTFHNLSGSFSTPSNPKNIEVELGYDLAGKRGSLNKKNKKTYRPEKVSGYYVEYLDKIVKICLEKHITCVFLTQPNGYNEYASDEYKAGLWMTPFESNYSLDFQSLSYISDLYNNYLMNYAEKAGVHSLDLSKSVPGSYEFLYDDCHFNENGASKVSTIIAEFLEPIIRKDLSQQ